ncbi:MAG: Gldg family protein, partial [Gammaproteobacteria bacterium]
EASRQLLTALDEMPVITVYATENDQIRQPIDELLQRYRRAQPDIAVRYVNPELEPDQTRERGITSNGELIISLAGRQQIVSQPSEQNITNAIQQLARTGDRWLLFIEGHGERKIEGAANHDLGQWGKQLQARGINVRRYNLTDSPIIPDNTAAIVIASPQLDYLPGEINMIRDYIKQGGNLLWLAEPGSIHQLDPVAEQLALAFKPGTIVDPDVQAMGINDPRFAVVSQYPQQTITRDFNAITLFPKARALDLAQTDQWQRSVILQSSARSWSETGELAGRINMDPQQDIPGPLVFGVAQTRNLETTGQTQDTDNGLTVSREQRVIVIGDGDFLSNTYLGNGGNLKLGLNMVNWLSDDERFMNIPLKTTPDLNIQLTTTSKGVIAIGFFLLIPLLLAGSGTAIWLRRRKR